MDTWTGRAPSHLLEFLTTSTRYGGQNGSNQCGKMSSAHLVFLRGDGGYKKVESDYMEWMQLTLSGSHAVRCTTGCLSRWSDR